MKRLRYHQRCQKKALLTIIIIITLLILVGLTILNILYNIFKLSGTNMKYFASSQINAMSVATTTTVNLKELNLEIQPPITTRESVYFDFVEDQLIGAQRELIGYEMMGYRFFGGQNTTTHLNSLIMDKGGEPVRNLVFATWRSGSTFLGDMLNSHPGTFYHYEPLLHMEVKQMRSKVESEKSLKILSHLLSCNYTSRDMEEFNMFDKYENQERNWHNKRMWRICAKHREYCKHPKFMEEMCKLFPFQSLKTVRLRVKLGRALLENKRFDVRLLLLVRDPRAIVRSRKHSNWCHNGPDCNDPEILCNDMDQDRKYAEVLRRLYPDRFLVLRYEDISLNPFQAAKKMFKFFRLNFHPHVADFLKTHTIKNFGGIASTYRDSKQTPFKWKQEFYRGRDNGAWILKNIQRNCSKVMKSWGYVPVSNGSELLSLNTLKEPPWPEMVITK